MDYMFAAVLAFDQLLTWDLSKVKKERRHPSPRRYPNR